MKKSASVIVFFILLLSCSSSNNTIQDETIENQFTEWLIPINEIRDGGPGKDGIPSIDNPKFVDASSATFLDPNDLVVGIFRDGVARAYPHIVLDWHEVVNDELNGSFFTLNYCPLTGTAFAWESESNNQRSTFGVSGLLYNANLIMYDRNTDSNWSQLGLECVNGELIRDTPKLYGVVETDWNTWRTLYPNTQVLSTDTGFSRNYGVSPYGDYATNNDRFIFRPEIINTALPNKQRIYAIIDDDKSKVYQFLDFENGNVIKDRFNEKNYLIVGNGSLITGFELKASQSNLDFEFERNITTATLFKDNEGNTWSVFGEALSGPRIGETLTPVTSVISYWFAIAAFYPNPEIYN